MMRNLWMERAYLVEEDEVVLVQQSPHTKAWFDRMPSELAVIVPEKRHLERAEDFAPKVGIAYHLSLSKYGIEGVLRLPRKYFRYERQVLYNRSLQPQQPFWVILREAAVKKKVVCF